MIQHNAELLCEPAQYVHYIKATFSDHAPARNSLVTQFLGDWLVQLDTDHAFDPDLVARLVRLADRYGVDVVSGMYQMKGAPHVSVIWAGDPMQPIVRLPDNPPPLLEIQSAGAGCLFVRRSVFELMAKTFPGVGAFDRIGINSEDHSFFQRCRELKIPCYLAPKIHSAHLRVAPVEWHDLNPETVQIQTQMVGGVA